MAEDVTDLDRMTDAEARALHAIEVVFAPVPRVGQRFAPRPSAPGAHWRHIALPREA